MDVTQTWLWVDENGVTNQVEGNFATDWLFILSLKPDQYEPKFTDWLRFYWEDYYTDRFDLSKALYKYREFLKLSPRFALDGGDPNAYERKLEIASYELDLKESLKLQLQTITMLLDEQNKTRRALELLAIENAAIAKFNAEQSLAIETYNKWVERARNPLDWESWKYFAGNVFPKLLKAAPVVASIGEAIGTLAYEPIYTDVGHKQINTSPTQGLGMEAFKQTFALSGFASVVQDLDYHMPYTYQRELKIPQYSYDFKTKTIVQLPEISALDLEKRANARDAQSATRIRAKEEAAYKKAMLKQQSEAEKAAVKAKREADAKARQLEKENKKLKSRELVKLSGKLSEEYLDDREDAKNTLNRKLAEIELEFTKSKKLLRARPPDPEASEDLRYWYVTSKKNAQIAYDSRLHELTDNYRKALNMLSASKYD